ncbi:MAG: hypothetical protein Q8R12_02735 [bacterium]|nr:hypothetical protein [bacterium]
MGSNPIEPAFVSLKLDFGAAMPAKESESGLRFAEVNYKGRPL